MNEFLLWELIVGMILGGIFMWAVTWSIMDTMMTRLKFQFLKEKEEFIMTAIKKKLAKMNNA